jgi:hypothetical protein
MAEHTQNKHEAWSSYPETVLIFSGEPEMMIDLRAPVPQATKNALAAIGLDEPFGILTSFDPGGQNLPAEENARRFSELEAELRSSGIEYLVLDACSPDKSHCEGSVAVKVDRGRALEIARRWEQIAIFWWDLDRFWIYGAVSNIESLSLPL